MKPLYAFFLLLLTGCSFPKIDRNDPESQLPPETQTGANTFGCLVNGEVWTYRPSGNPGHNNLTAAYDGNKMFVLAKREDTSIKFDFSGGGITHLGNYILYSDSSTVYYRSEAYGYFTDSLNNGTLIMTRLDKENGILSGRFHFNAVNHLGDTVRITDGRFDVKYLY